MELKTPIEQIIGIGPVYVKRLHRLGIKTVEDLLYHFPFRYEDFRKITPINQLVTGEVHSITGEIWQIKNSYTKTHKVITTAIINDGTGSCEAVWFNQPYLTRVLKAGMQIGLAGKVKWFAGKKVFESPEYEIVRSSELIHMGRLVPVYPETARLTSRWLRSKIAPLLEVCAPKLLDFLPFEVRGQDLPSLRDAVCQIHFPQNLQQAQKARERLAFDELFLIQLAAQKRKLAWQEEKRSYKLQVISYKSKIDEFTKSLPFQLTSAQKRVTEEILSDLAKERPMNRLLEGDVGSGKTAVSTIAMHVCFLNGLKSALMAPTEILAFQHYQTVKSLLEPHGLKIALQTSTFKPQTSNFKFDIVVGTHALIFDKIQFDNLGLVVIDEQHRFGVAQRAKLKSKNPALSPHYLTMTATPIPRTLALTLYGDLDLSYLDEMPRGRQKVGTYVVPPHKRNGAYEFIKKEVFLDHQVFIICPLIEESETLQTVRAVTTEFERLREEVFGKQKLGLLHGRLKSAEKEKILRDFQEKKIDILVATPVVEVGIDIPNATVMMIEGAERFGLAQLHQLRGRVGRSNLQSYCFLFTESESPKVTARLRAMEKIHIGAKLAELDLKLRGAGEIYGTRQHGFANLKVASLTDLALIEKTKKAAEKILEEDPQLLKYPLLKRKLEELTSVPVEPD